MTHRRTISGAGRGLYEPLKHEDPPIDLSVRDLAGNAVTSPILSTRPRSGSVTLSPFTAFLARWADTRNLFIVLVLLFVVGGWVAFPNDTSLTDKEADEASFAAIDDIGAKLPWGLEQRIWETFDAHVQAGKIIYDDYPASKVDRPDSFDFLFRTTPSLVNEPGALSQNHGEKLVSFGAYTLRLPLSTPHRPTIYLSPTKPQPASADLAPEDLVAALSVMRAFEAPMLATFSAGIAAHPTDEKTIRIFPAPQDFPLWPEKLDSDFFIGMRLPVPFRAYGLRLPENADARAATKALHRLLAETKKTLVKENAAFFPKDEVSAFAKQKLAAEEKDETLRQKKIAAAAQASNQRYGYTILFHKDWIVSIPRREPGPAINGMGEGRVAPGEVMLGIVSVASEEQKAWWQDVGYEAYLGSLGFPPMEKEWERPGKKEEEVLEGEKKVLQMIEDSKGPP